MGLEDAGGGGGLTAVGSKKKSGKRVESKKTFCFTLELKDLESCEYNEFNWLDLVAQEEDKKRKRSSFGEDEEEDEEMKALARKYEAKYGSEAIKKKKKVRRLDDYADLGYGYDSNDPFIDNSDAYDEIVPRDVTTAHGGFYVNSGPLEFKERDSAAEDSDLDQTQPLPNTSNKAASATAAPPTSTTTTNPGPKKRKRPKKETEAAALSPKKVPKKDPLATAPPPPPPPSTPPSKPGKKTPGPKPGMPNGKKKKVVLKVSTPGSIETTKQKKAMSFLKIH